MKLSIVSTLYNSEKFIPKLIEELTKVVEEIGIDKRDYEIILVDDGSPDNSLKVALEEKKKYKDVNIIILELSRNFGHHKAFWAGISKSIGEYVFLIDSDMDVHPSYLKSFYSEILNQEDVDVVYGVLKDRKLIKTTSNLFWKFFNYVSDVPVPLNITTERIMNRNYVNALLSLNDFNLFIGGLYYWVGFHQKSIEVRRISNRKKSNYVLTKRIHLFIEALTSFTSYPIWLILRLSLYLNVASIIYLFYLIIRKILYPETILLGYASIGALLVFFGSLIIFIICFIGIYIEKIFNQVKQRPRYIVRKEYKNLI
ncbi:MAG: glycosyltransferase family 2 protein [Bacteroidota bacterium]